MKYQLIALFGTLFAMMLWISPAAAAVFPLVEGYGGVTPLPNAAFQPNPAEHYKVVFDVRGPFEKWDSPNSGLVHVAKFLNVLATAKMDMDKVDVAVVIHGSATPIVLQNSVFKEKYHVDNPNLPLMAKLKTAGVRIYVCGQALADKHFKPEWVDGNVQEALSALVALTMLENQGYAYIPFL